MSGSLGPKSKLHKVTSWYSVENLSRLPQIPENVIRVNVYYHTHKENQKSWNSPQNFSLILKLVLHFLKMSLAQIFICVFRVIKSGSFFKNYMYMYFMYNKNVSSTSTATLTVDLIIITYMCIICTIAY